ncbi:unnamed protein product [Candidula unifasciata]|uniref:SYO1-like TPR repeats domain-containing protein n=1 Tax=Candidula unifasciata TaxID=100452 RepID=A0A8S3YVC5_9EUPU|nr:unnamed protein product [Candidula unifasciata]
MGKSRTRRFGNLRPNPTGLISERNMEMDPELGTDPQQNSGVPATITNIIEKLQASAAEERTCGCQLLASIVSQPKAIGFLLQENVVKIVAPLFLDSCTDVRKSALGALRNMSVYGHPDVCDVMVAKDVLTPLTALIRQYGDNWVPQKECTKYDTSNSVLIEAVELLANLCESSNIAVQWFNKENLLQVLLPLLKVDTYGYDLSLAVARCLHVVSDNNKDVSKVCQQSEVFSQLLSIISAAPSGIDAVLFRTLVTGILLNVTDVDLTKYYAGIVATISEVLEMDCFAVIVAALEGNHETTEEIESEMSWPEVDKLLSAQGISLELLANLCYSDDDWEDMEGLQSSESSDDAAVEAAPETTDVMEDTVGTLCLSSEVSSAFLEKDILSKILRKAAPLDIALMLRLNSSQRGRNTLKKLADLQTRALLCLSNLVAVIDESCFTQLVPLSSMWTELYKLASTSKEGLNEDYTWAVTSAMRAVIHRLADTQMSHFADTSDSDLDFLVNLAKDNKNRDTQINIVRIISTVGCALSANAQPHPLLKKIGSVLADVAFYADDLVVTAEALDSLFDVFKEDHTDEVVREIGLVEKLVALQPSFRTKVSHQRKHLGENYAVVMMAKSNLAGYIKYKQSQK